MCHSPGLWSNFCPFHTSRIVCFLCDWAGWLLWFWFYNTQSKIALTKTVWFFTFCFRGHKVIAVTLLQHGADTTIKNNSGKKMCWMCIVLETICKLEVGCLRYPGASTIGSQLLDGDCSHGWQILASQPWAPMQKGGQAPVTLSEQWKRGREVEGGGGLEDELPHKIQGQ